MSSSLPPAVYCDTSALAKLVIPERESTDFTEFVTNSSGQLVTSEFGEIELMRAAGRISDQTVDSALEILAQMILLPMTSSMRLRANYLKPPLLRSLDAVHLATAMEIVTDLDCLVTYDARLTEAAVVAGLRVMSPGIELSDG